MPSPPLSFGFMQYAHCLGWVAFNFRNLSRSIMIPNMQNMHPVRP